VKLNEIINELLAKLRQKNDDIIVLFVTSIKDKTNLKKDYDDHSLQSEFFSHQELEFLISSVRDFNLELKLFYNQKSYIDYITNERDSSKKYIVYDSVMQYPILGEGHSLLIPSFNKEYSILNTSESDFVNAILMNKYYYYKILESKTIPFPETCYYSYEHGWLFSKKPKNGQKILIKLSVESCSIGLSNDSIKIYDKSIDTLIHKTSLKYMQPVIVQEYITGLEVEIPVVVLQGNPEILNPVRIVKKNNEPLYYDIIYDDNYSFSLLKDTHPMYYSLMSTAKEITNIIGVKKYFRVDCIVRENEFYIIDINTYPHIVKDSSFGYVFDQTGVGANNIIPLLLANQIFDL
jgi:D-alanine-D-alanine ligase